MLGVDARCSLARIRTLHARHMPAEGACGEERSGGIPSSYLAVDKTSKLSQNDQGHGRDHMMPDKPMMAARCAVSCASHFVRTNSKVSWTKHPVSSAWSIASKRGGNALECSVQSFRSINHTVASQISYYQAYLYSMYLNLDSINLH